MINKINNIQPGQVLVYWTGESHIKDYVLRNAAYNKYKNDEAYILQRVVNRTSARNLKEFDHNTYEYILIGKVAPPDEKEVAKRKRADIEMSGKTERFRSVKNI